jgi:hypothetical protein
VSDGSDQTTELPAPGEPRPVVTDAQTITLPAAESAFRPQQIALVFLAVAAAAFLLGIAIATATQPRSDQTVVVSEVVGPSGKTIRFDGGEIHIPEGALGETVRIVVRRSAVNDRIRVETAGDEFVPRGRLFAYSFEPTNVTFREPVELTFRLPDDARNATVFARRNSTVVLLTGTVDINRGTATAVVRDFRFEGTSR